MIKPPYTIAYRVCKDLELSDLCWQGGNVVFVDIYIDFVNIMVDEHGEMHMYWNVLAGNPEKLLLFISSLDWPSVALGVNLIAILYLIDLLVIVYIPCGCCFYLLCVLFLGWFMIIPTLLHHIACLLQHWYGKIIKDKGWSWTAKYI